MIFQDVVAHDYTRQTLASDQHGSSKAVLVSDAFATGHLYAVTGQLDLAQEQLDRVLVTSRSIGDVCHQSCALAVLAMRWNWIGEYDAAVRAAAAGLRLARAHNLPFALLAACLCHGIALTGRGSYDDALAAFEAGLALAENMAAEVWRHRFLNSLGWLYSECGDLNRAVDFNRRSAAAARQGGAAETIAHAELNLSDCFLVQGAFALAQALLEGIEGRANDPTVVRAGMTWRYTTHLFVSLGELWLAHGDVTRARRFAEQSLDIATRTRSRKYIVRAQRLQGEIALAQRHWDEAEHWLRPALLLARTVGNPPQLWQTYLTLGRLYTATDQPVPAQAFYQAARDVIYRIKMTLKSSALRDSLSRAPGLHQVDDFRVSGA